CYVPYRNVSRDTFERRHSSDGGRTWSAPASVDAQRAPAIANGVQVVTRPNGSVLLVFAVFGAQIGNEIAASTSIDGGTTFSPATRAAELDGGELSWLRAAPFPSVD